MSDRIRTRHPFAAPDRITVVSGPPRSGTSLSMQILEAAGLRSRRTKSRPRDPDNPRGYYELDAVEAHPADARFLEDCRGGSSSSSPRCCSSCRRSLAYRVLFIERDLGEILASQRAMLARQGTAGFRGGGSRPRARLRVGPRALPRLARSQSQGSRRYSSTTARSSSRPGETVARIARFLEETGGGIAAPLS